jgi:hypothetical protein
MDERTQSDGGGTHLGGEPLGRPDEGLELWSISASYPKARTTATGGKTTVETDEMGGFPLHQVPG